MSSIMSRIVLPIALVTITMALAPPAQAGLVRTFISAAGNDANACTVTAPCRTLATAYATTLAGGIITALDPAGYGPLTISQAITIEGNGWAAITAPANGAGITVNAGDSDMIYLRGLTLDGGGAAGTTGILFTAGGSLTVDDCVVRNMAGNGLKFSGFRRGNSIPPQGLAVFNSHFNGNGQAGILVTTPPIMGTGNVGLIVADIDRTELNGNLTGVTVDGTQNPSTMIVEVTNSVASNNNVGFQALAQNGVSTGVELKVIDSQAAGNGTGIQVIGSTAGMPLARTTVTGNAIGFFTDQGGSIGSYSDNYFAGNGASSGTVIPLNKQ